MWRLMRADEDVRRAINELGLEGKLQELAADEASRRYASIDGRFSSSPGARWIWEHLRPKGTSCQFAAGRAFTRLAEIVPSEIEQLLFFAGSDKAPKATYRGTIDAIAAVIGDCSFFEYLIVPLSTDWLVCENHHGAVIAVGDPVESRLRMLSPG